MRMNLRYTANIFFCVVMLLVRVMTIESYHMHVRPKHGISMLFLKVNVLAALIAAVCWVSWCWQSHLGPRSNATEVCWVFSIMLSGKKGTGSQTGHGGDR